MWISINQDDPYYLIISTNNESNLKKIRETTGWPMNMQSDAEITKLRKLGVAGKGGKLRVSPSYGEFVMVFKVITLYHRCVRKK